MEGSEQRRTERAPTRLLIYVERLDPPAAAGFYAAAEDLSEVATRIRTSRRLLPGERMGLWIPLAGGQETVFVEGRVTRSDAEFQQIGLIRGGLRLRRAYRYVLWFHHLTIPVRDRIRGWVASRRVA